MGRTLLWSSRFRGWRSFPRPVPAVPMAGAVETEPKVMDPGAVTMADAAIVAVVVVVIPDDMGTAVSGVVAIATSDRDPAVTAAVVPIPPAVAVPPRRGTTVIRWPHAVLVSGKVQSAGVAQHGL